MKILSLLLVLVCSLTGCVENTMQKDNSDNVSPAGPYLMVLGTAQDAGMPHINNPAEFSAFAEAKKEALPVSCLGVVDTENRRKYLFDATPDMPLQLDALNKQLKTENLVDGIFLTHAHIGHYTGLMYLGREAMAAEAIPVYAMPRMKTFLEQNGPWSQLVDLKNIEIRRLAADSVIALSRTTNLKVTPFLVPHREEFSETVGIKIEGPNKSALFIPDINKWHLWAKDIVAEVKKVDYAFLDATFFANGEIPRPMSEVPHPFIEETVGLFEDEDVSVKNKVIFIHFNHSNPAIDKASAERQKLEEQGFRFAEVGQVFPL